MRPIRCGVTLSIALLTAVACGKDSPPTAPTPEATLIRMDIDGPTQRALEAPGATTQLRAIAQLSDGTRPDVTNDAVWSVVNPDVLSVSRGLVTGVANGGTIVTATYRGWSSVTNVTVGPNGGRPSFALTAVVRDAESGVPIPGAQFRQGSSEFTRVLGVSDGNGFVDLGVISGQFLAWVARFGYEDASVNLPSVREATALDVRLRPNGPFIERTLAGRFDAPPPGYEESQASLHLNTRAGGVFDAVMVPSECRPNVGVRIFAESGGVTVTGRPEPACGARIRFVVPASDVLLTLLGTGATDWQLTYREPR